MPRINTSISPKAFHRCLRSLLLWALLVGSLPFATAQHLEIHQININNGDASVIVTKGADGEIRTAVLIDGGLTSSANFLVPYLNTYIQKRHFDMVIVSHYHTDHYKGLVNLFKADKPANQLINKHDMEEGKLDGITTNVLIDPGGFSWDGAQKKFVLTLPYVDPATDNSKPQFPLKTDKGGNLILAGDHPQPAYWAGRFLSGVTAMYKRHNFERYSPEGFPAYFNTAIQIDILDDGQGHAVPVTLRCVAMNSFNLKADGLGFKNTRVIKGGNNANNFSFAWVLEFGQFRYFTGGDLGGHEDGAYIDQESDVADYLKTAYPENIPLDRYAPDGDKFPGHVCAMKANHHGSNESNSQAFIDVCAPSAFITSVGSNAGWHLPAVPFLGRLKAMKKFNDNRYFYFTGLYAYPDYRVDMSAFEEGAVPVDEGDVGEEESDFYTQAPLTDAECRDRRAVVIAQLGTQPGTFIADQNHYIIKVNLMNKMFGVIGALPISKRSMFELMTVPAPQKDPEKGPTEALPTEFSTTGIMCHDEK